MRLKKPVVWCRKKKILAAYKISASLFKYFVKMPKNRTFSTKKRQISNEIFLIGCRSIMTSLKNDDLDLSVPSADGRRPSKANRLTKILTSPTKFPKSESILTI